MQSSTSLKKDEIDPDRVRHSNKDASLTYAECTYLCTYLLHAYVIYLNETKPKKMFELEGFRLRDPRMILCRARPPGRRVITYNTYLLYYL